MNKRFKKEERANFILHFNNCHQVEILALAKILAENQELVQARLTNVDRGGIDLAAIERSGEIHHLRVEFSGRIYDIQSATKATNELIGSLLI